MRFRQQLVAILYKLVAELANSRGLLLKRLVGASDNAQQFDTLGLERRRDFLQVGQRGCNCHFDFRQPLLDRCRLLAVGIGC